MSSHLRSKHKIEKGQKQEDSGSRQLILQESLQNSTENTVASKSNAPPNL